MRKVYPYLKDETFLSNLFTHNMKKTVKMTILDLQEEPIKEISGQLISGSINIDGASALRRTGSLQLIVKQNNQLDNPKNIIFMNKRIYLEVGIENTINDKYDKMVFFPLGIYIITDANITHNVNSSTISVSFKDKMCLLNGDCGGVLPASVTFHEVETVNAEGETVVEYPTIYQIIQECVHHFGGEDQSKIFIHDVDERVRRIMKYMGNDPLYLYGDEKSKIEFGSEQAPASGAQVVKVFEQGQDMGYIYVDFIYPEDLIGNAGESVVSVLDKIKNKLGNYEYFYDIYGNFIFQQKKNYLNTSKSTYDINQLGLDDYVADYAKGQAAYVFNNSNLITSFQNTPKYSGVKNDFIIWGKKKLSDGNTMPIRYHLAIDDKPFAGNTYVIGIYKDELEEVEKAKLITKVNSTAELPMPGIFDVYYQVENKDILTWNEETLTYDIVDMEVRSITTNDWRSELYYQGIMASTLALESNSYYTELVEEWPKLFNIKDNEWRQETLDAPDKIDYFLDFIDGAEVSDYSISSIGRRPQVIQNDDVNCLFLPEVPDYIIINKDSEDKEELIQECLDRGEYYITVSGEVYDSLENGGASYSAYEELQSVLYSSTSLNENISLTTLPIYHLEPNTIIKVEDSVTGIQGNYVITKISLNLDVRQTSTISCERALKRI